MTEPPLLMLAEGRRPRPRPRRPVMIRPKEIALHMSVADMLRRFVRADWRWGHYPAGEHRDVRTAAKLKAMGTQAGWPDFVLFDPSGRLHALELKRQGEDLSGAQRAFAEWCGEHAIPHAVARTFDQALAILAGWGALRVKIGGAT